ncbi:protein DpdH [Burkholderia gladioli]|uniref:protein DpdH n=1 Tax=Burkholderia gladioli TaxID=28095 RepID=UPI0016420E2E|nr:protein DpdH [Burkholderia gladioli]
MMRNHLCWEPSAVRQVINPFAEHIPDSLFRAVHSEWDLQLTPPVGQRYQDVTTAAWAKMTPADFLFDFLRQDRPHALAAILGDTGSGKSHLVHWMRLHVRDNAQRMVLIVRKSGTSLRAIVREIIGKLPPDQQRGFLETFNLAGDGAMTPEGRRRELLHHLGQAIREDKPTSAADELEEALIEVLPNLFQDPYMQKEHFLRDGKVAAEIVDHIFEQSRADDRPDRRRVFAADDLVLGGQDYLNATKLAQHAIQLIEADPENLPAAIRVINRNLDKAVARTLSFSGDRVEELMAGLRRYLKSQGRELVLLIEEFARLQGIDRALLQAITTQGDSGQGETGLCRMRTAIAVTPGFFESVEDTAYRRTTHIVDMNWSTGHAHGQTTTSASLASFSAKYLNAVRLGREKIERWSESAQPGQMAPSQCTQCPLVVECHATFGSVDGYGLYPFTEQALWIGAGRVDRSQSGRLNPRTIQNDLLVEVLDTFAPSIAAGEYPPLRLLEKLGGVKQLPLAAETQLKRQNQQVAERWMALLELYDGTGAVINLPEPLRDAFTVPKIPEAGEFPLADAPLSPPTPQAPVSAVSVDADNLAIQLWIRGDGLDATVAQKLRELIYAAVVGAIDWDMLGLSRTYFAGPGRAFQQRKGIYFVRQNTKRAMYADVQLEIDADPQTGQALQGLLLAAKNGFRWRFDGADRALTSYLDCVERWAKQVEQQLQKLSAPSSSWRQADAAINLLCIGAAIGGRLKAAPTAAELIEAAFGNWPDDPAPAAGQLRSLYAKLLRHREELIDAARSQASSLKGGRYGAMLDPQRVLGPIRQLRRAKWRLGLKPPEDDTSLLASLYREIAETLPGAAGAERSQRLQWLEEMLRSFGDGATRATIVATLTTARQAVLDAGIPAQNSSRPLQDALDAFQTVQFDASISAARMLLETEDAVAVLPEYGRGRANAVTAGTALRLAAEKFLDSVERDLQSFGDDQDARTSEAAKNMATLDEALGNIVNDLAAMEAGNVA